MPKAARSLTYDGKAFTRGGAVISGCTLHEGKRGIVKSFPSHITAAYVEFEDGSMHCVPLHMLDRA
jgi:hypothetical protein